MGECGLLSRSVKLGVTLPTTGSTASAVADEEAGHDPATLPVVVRADQFPATEPTPRLAELVGASV
jgi:hypothetical protein